MMRNSLLGAVMLWATDFFPFLKKVSGVHTLFTIKLFSLSISTGPSYINLRSTQVCLKKTSMVYSYDRDRDRYNKRSGRRSCCSAPAFPQSLCDISGIQKYPLNDVLLAWTTPVYVPFQHLRQAQNLSHICLSWPQLQDLLGEWNRPNDLCLRHSKMLKILWINRLLNENEGC